MKCIVYKNWQSNPFIKNLGEPKTVIFSELQVMHTLSTYYSPLCLLTAYSLWNIHTLVSLLSKVRSCECRIFVWLNHPINSFFYVIQLEVEDMSSWGGGEFGKFIAWSFILIHRLFYLIIGTWLTVTNNRNPDGSTVTHLSLHRPYRPTCVLWPTNQVHSSAHIRLVALHQEIGPPPTPHKLTNNTT